MVTEQYLNTPTKSCHTCIHRKPSEHLEVFDFCRRQRLYCMQAVSYDDRCGKDLKDWKPIPPKPLRRSLRRWLLDIIWE